VDFHGMLLSLPPMADSKRRDFLKLQVGAGTAFAAGLVGGGAIVSKTSIRYLWEEQEPLLPRWAQYSFAQQGEDLVLWNILVDALKLHQPSYLDVGAYHPVRSNNTYLFYERNCQGVLVEPNPDLWETLTKERPRDVLIRGGIGVDGTDSEADYYVIGIADQLNTFSKQVAEEYAARADFRYSIRKVLRLPLLDINRLMQKHWGGAPSLLSIDTEGFELPILRSIDWKRYRPAVVCVETLASRQAILKLMAGLGYDIRGATFVNTIFVDRGRL
jgi:FkbM family methyltransferase